MTTTGVFVSGRPVRRRLTYRQNVSFTESIAEQKVAAETHTMCKRTHCIDRRTNMIWSIKISLFDRDVRKCMKIHIEEGVYLNCIRATTSTRV